MTTGRVDFPPQRLEGESGRRTGDAWGLINAWHRQGWSQRTSARELDVEPHTVRRTLDQETRPPSRRRVTAATLRAGYEECIRHRVVEVDANAHRLLQELGPRGSRGGYDTVKLVICSRGERMATPGPLTGPDQGLWPRHAAPRGSRSPAAGEHRSVWPLPQDPVPARALALAEALVNERPGGQGGSQSASPTAADSGASAAAHMGHSPRAPRGPARAGRQGGARRCRLPRPAARRRGGLEAGPA
jgi:hypothetical protein